MRKVDKMARNFTVSSHLTDQRFRCMRKTVVPERHRVVYSGISNQGRLRVTGNITSGERRIIGGLKRIRRRIGRRIRRLSRIWIQKRLPV